MKVHGTKIELLEALAEVPHSERTPLFHETVIRINDVKAPLEARLFIDINDDVMYRYVVTALTANKLTP